MSKAAAILSALEHIRAKVNHLTVLVTLNDLKDQDLDKAVDEILYDLAVIHSQQKGPNP